MGESRRPGSPASRASAQEILDYVTAMFAKLTRHLDIGPIVPGLALKNLGLPSITILYALADFQDHFGLRDELLEQLLAGVLMPDEHTIGELAQTIADVLGAHAP